MRKDLVQRFTKLITSFNMNVSIRPVGSYVTGLYLPTSDIDMVITFALHDGYSLASRYSSRLYILSGKIRDSGFCSKIEDVLQASVPLIRITDKIDPAKYNHRYGIESVWHQTHPGVIQSAYRSLADLESKRKSGGWVGLAR